MPAGAGLCSVQPLWALLKPIISLDDKLRFNLGSRIFKIHGYQELWHATPLSTTPRGGLGSCLAPEVCTALYLVILSKHPNIQTPLTPTPTPTLTPG